MALTLIEAAKVALNKDEILKATVMELYAQSSDILKYIGFENISGNALSFNREKTLPEVGFRNINQGFQESTGDVDRITESLSIAGGDIDVDIALVKTHGEEQRTTQEKMKIKALALAMTKTFIKGDQVSVSEEFNGMQVRAQGDQIIDAGNSSGGDPLSLNSLDELIDTVEDPTHLIMNKALRRKLTQAARNPSVGGYITYDKDSFGQRITMYNELPIIIADKDNNNDYILPFSEIGGGGGAANNTSIYCVSFTDDGVVGLQNGDMDVRDLGEVDDKPVFRTRVDWLISLIQFRERALGRLRGIRDLPVVA